MNNVEQALTEYLDKEYPLVKDDEYYEMIYSDVSYGRQIYKQEALNWRKRATPIFIAGYMAAFKDGNESPNSNLTVVSKFSTLNKTEELK